MTKDDRDFQGRIGRTYRESQPWWPTPTRAPEGAPDIVFVVLDDVGFSDLACYGSDILTPSMDSLASAGLRYNNFHVTAMCSPTRACLLTGRNAHATGVGVITEWGGGYPGYRGRISRSTSTLAEILGQSGYRNLCVGKWHLTPNSDFTAAGPFDHWPLARGFHRWYGFHGSQMDHWHPELYEDNRPITPATPEGYHLSADLAERSIAMIRDHVAAAPTTPYFLYLAFGACHFPHHAPGDYVARYKGRYDAGWDSVREKRFERQRSIGIVPPSTRLAPRNPDVPEWKNLSADSREVAARLQEVYAAFLEHTDAQIGRLADFLAAVGRLDNTIFIVLSDNGASSEGGQSGTWHQRKHVVYDRETIAQTRAKLEQLGSAETYSHYPSGWAQVSNTPLKWYKKDTHGGGIRAPLIVHWPNRIRDAGAIRNQYHHVIDIVPTVLDVLGIAAPDRFGGIEQVPMHGVSMAYTLEDGTAPTRKHIQHFELLGDRAIWQDGWKAVARHNKGDDFDADRWELYHLDEDFSECGDLAADEPERLESLIALWWKEAEANGVLPLDDREWERFAERRAVAAPPRRYVYYPGIAHIDRLSAPNVTERTHRIEARVVVSGESAQGVLLAFGGPYTGYVLYVRNGRLAYEYAYSERERVVLISDREIPRGPCVLALRCEKGAEGGLRATLWQDSVQVAAGDIPRMWPLRGATGGLYCGRDAGPGVSSSYRTPFVFSGTIERVVVELDT